MAGFPDTPNTLIGRLCQEPGTVEWHRAWQTFQELYLPAIRLSVLRAYMRYGWHDVPGQLADDTVSDVAVGLLKAQDTFRYDPAEGRFRGYVGQLIHWKVMDRLKGMRKEPHESDEMLANIAAPEANAFELLAVDADNEAFARKIGALDFSEIFLIEEGLLD